MEARPQCSPSPWGAHDVKARKLVINKSGAAKIQYIFERFREIGSGNHSNARRLFEMLNGHEPEPMRAGKFRQLAEAPPVPTTSIFTRADGVVHWRGSIQQPGTNARTENIEVFASHLGLGVNPAVMLAIADRLAQPENEWAPFAPAGLAALAFPRKALN